MRWALSAVDASVPVVIRGTTPLCDCHFSYLRFMQVEADTDRNVYTFPKEV